LASCCGRLTRRNSVLDELSVKRYHAKKSNPRKYLLETMLKLSDAGVKNRWIEREEKLCVVSIKAVVQGKWRNKKY